MLLALLPIQGLLEAALAIINRFSALSGCKINWRKTKIICVHIDVTPIRLQHIERISGDLSHVYLGLPFTEDKEIAEVGRLICVRFIQKARALQVLELSMPARIVAINQILTASLWYFIFAWAPCPVTYKRLQGIITNFVWDKSIDNQKRLLKSSVGSSYAEKAGRRVGSRRPGEKVAGSPREVGPQGIVPGYLPLEEFRYAQAGANCCG